MLYQRVLWIGVCMTLVLCFQSQAVMAQEASSKSFYRSNFYPRLPDFEPLKNLNLNNPKTAILQLGDLMGKIVVINVWFTTCPPCIEEIPQLNQLVEKYRQDSSFVFLAVAKNSKEELATFLKNGSFNYIQALSNSDFDTLLGGSYPRNIIVDKGGVVAYDRIGGNKRIYAELDSTIQELKANQR